MTRSSLDASLMFLAMMGVVVAVMMLRSVKAPHRVVRDEKHEVRELGGALAASLLAAALFAERLINLAPVLVLFLMTAATISYLATRLTISGVLWRATQVTGLFVAGLWTSLMIGESGMATGLKALGWLALVLGTALAAAEIVAGFAREAIFTHEVWRRPTRAALRTADTPEPMVSLQVPCYAEPPALVNATLDWLAALEYANYEVLVCDNNTQDEALWRPVEAHCAVLNRRLGREVFRFFHVAPLSGAKAGALNWLLPRMAPAAELIGVIDADYHSQPDFLRRLSPFFDNARLGYIQTPHDYHGYEVSDYLTACYWEYMPANKCDWPGVSEYGGAFTIGTMCLIRAEALRRAGGWAEWCLTEDSEISVRLRAAGYEGLYFGETFGRGLIPDTFDDYRKQRFRWTAGPVQQLRRHWRLFLPAPFAAPLPGWTKLLEIARCATPLLRLAGIVTGLLALCALALARASGLLAGEIDVPNVLWALLLLGALSFGLRTVHRYRLSGCHSWRDMVLGEVARASLSHVVLLAGLAGLSSRPLAWRRTPKFTVTDADERPLVTARAEMLTGGACLLAALVLLLGSGAWGWELGLLGALGLVTMGGAFLCAPIMVVLAGSRPARASAAEAGSGDIERRAPA